MTILEKAKEANKIMEFHESEKDERGEIKRESFYSFTREAINSDNPYYRSIGDLIRDSELDEDSAYRFTAEAILSIIEHLDGLTQEEQDAIDLEDYELIQSDSEAPIYYYNIREWFARGNENAVDNVVNEYGISEKDFSISSLIQQAYTRAWENNYMTVVNILKDIEV